MFESFIEAKKTRSKKYQTDLRYTLPRFSALHERLACEIPALEIEEQLQGLTATVHNAFLRYLKAAFNFGIRRGWCTDNPAKRIDMQRVKTRRQILSNQQVRALLRTVCERDLELLPYSVICIFAGVRPEEVCRLDWDNIHLREPTPYIEIPEEKSKTDIRTIPDMEPLLVEWLNYFIRRGGKTTGAVTPKSNLRKRLRELRKAAKIQPWPQDAPRRTFASNWLAIHHDVNRLNNLMGHTSPTMLWRHYQRAVTQRNAREFWKIEPRKIAGKTIRFVAA